MPTVLARPVQAHPLTRPNHPPFPIFWADPSYDSTYTSVYYYYYYIGHYQCCSFDIQQKVVNGIERFALLEFEFVEFKAEIAQAMEKIAASTQGET